MEVNIKEIRRPTLKEAFFCRTTSMRYHDDQWSLIVNALKEYVDNHPEADEEATAIVRDLRIKWTVSAMGF